jgi:hypothetical protein
MAIPSWMTERGATLKKGNSDHVWFVLCNNQPHYRLVAVPVSGRFACAITQSINGRRIASDRQADSAADAILNGLDDLGKALGWC